MKYIAITITDEPFHKVFKKVKDKKSRVAGFHIIDKDTANTALNKFIALGKSAHNVCWKHLQLWNKRGFKV